jgi:rubredoxin
MPTEKYSWTSTEITDLLVEHLTLKWGKSFKNIRLYYPPSGGVELHVDHNPDTVFEMMGISRECPKCGVPLSHHTPEYCVYTADFDKRQLKSPLCVGGDWIDCCRCEYAHPGKIPVPEDIRLLREAVTPAT